MNMPLVPPTAPIPGQDPVKRAEHVRKSQKALVDTFTWECCPNCEHWDSKTEFCGKYQMRPPANVIVIGCVDYDAGIPF